MYRLIHGDCLDHLPKLEPDHSYNLILVDLPYGTTKCSWDSVIDLAELWRHMKRLIAPKGAIVLFGQEPFSSALVVSNPKWFKYKWIWNKVTGRGHLVAKIRPLQQTEDIMVFGKGKINYYPIMVPYDKPRKLKEYKRTEIMGGGLDTGYERISHYKYPKNLLTYSNAYFGGQLHPTQKPVDLLKYLVQTYTLEGDHVLDYTMGSGSTGVAAVELGRHFTGIELEEKYFKIAQRRLEAAYDNFLTLHT